MSKKKNIVNVLIRLPYDLHKQFKKLSAKNGKSMQLILTTHISTLVGAVSKDGRKENHDEDYVK